jgi:hypothetical protein
MPATVTLWHAVTAPPAVAYSDANFLILLYQAAYPPATPDARAVAAQRLHAAMQTAGSQLWTTPLALQEGAWRFVREVLEHEKRQRGHQALSLAQFQRRDRSGYDAALATARPAGVKFMTFVLRRTSTLVRWPQGATGEVVPALDCVRLARLHLRRYGVEAADALHAAYARWDYQSGQPACIISEDRHLQLVDGLAVYAYGHL